MRLPSRSQRRELWEKRGVVPARGAGLRAEAATAGPLASTEPGEVPSHWGAADLLTAVVLSETERRFKFRGLPQAVGAARRALRDWERYFEPDQFYDLSLCLSELVTSRVQHSAEGEIELAVRRAPSLVRAEISDPREDVAAAVTQAPLTTPADWGLFIIDRVADRWGVDSSAGTRVWCEIDLASQRPDESAPQA